MIFVHFIGFAVKMLHLELLECAYAYDVAVARAEARRLNVLARKSDPAFDLSDRKFVKRYRLSKDLTRELISELTPHFPPTVRSDALSVETKVRNHVFDVRNAPHKDERTP